MSELVPSINELPGDDEYRVTTFNILAPVWVHQSIYPGVDMSDLDGKTRRAKIGERILEMDSDVFLMQECQKSELDLILADSGGAIGAKYDVEFCGFPLTFWTNWLTDTTNFEPRETGVCVMTKKSVFRKKRAEHISIDRDEWRGKLPNYALGAHACLVWAEVLKGPARGRMLLIATSHLDADSAYRAGLQGTQLARVIKEHQGEADAIIWGGDFNMDFANSAMTTIRREGFRAASAVNTIPSVYSAFGTIRVDHILLFGDECFANKMYIPECPMGHLTAILPFVTQLQWVQCTVRGERGCALKVLVILLLMLLCPLLLIFILAMTVIHCVDKKNKARRCTWALNAWGSDHLPVTVTVDLSRFGGA